MPEFTSKELYMMNGGQKLYVYKDGFGDIYKATATEEAAWAIELINNTLVKIEKETNRTSLHFAIADLVYHKYENIEALLLKHINDPNPARQIVFASALWNMAGYEKSFDIIHQNLIQRRKESLNDVFLGLNDFKNHEAAKHFIIACLEGDDDELAAKAQYTISMWAWSGLLLLKEDNLLEQLKVENKHLHTFKPAIEKVKQILDILK